MRRWYDDDDLGDHVTMKKARSSGLSGCLGSLGTFDVYVCLYFYFFFLCYFCLSPCMFCFLCLRSAVMNALETVSLPSVAIFKFHDNDLGVVINTIWRNLGSFEGISEQ